MLPSRRPLPDQQPSPFDQRPCPDPRKMATLDENGREALVNEILAALHGYIDDDGLAAPYEIHVALAYA